MNTLAISLRHSLSALAFCCALVLTGCGGGTSTTTTTPPPPPATVNGGSLNVSSVTFGSVSMGIAAVPQLVLLTNTSGSLAVTGLSITGANPSSFAATSNCPATLTGGASCTISVTFTPAAVGALSATLTVTDNNTTTASQSVALTGTGVALTPVANFSATNISFAGQPIGAPAATQSVTVQNQGTANLIFSAITLTQSAAAFTLGGTCTATTSLAPGSSCTIAATFSATSTTPQTGAIAVTENAAGSPVTIALSGNTGLPFVAKVLAGSKPVSGATLQLFAAGTTGNGSTPTVLNVGTLTTDTTGTAQINLYNCPTSLAELYLISTGGTVGSAPPNAALTLLSAIGPCSQIVSGQTVTINEVTTVGDTFALAPFYAPGGKIGASATNTIGITNAFLSAQELVNSATGVAPGASLPSTVILPVARINSLANLLNTCAATVTAGSCSTLFSNAGASTTKPSNTLDAIYSIVHSPASNVALLYSASTASSAFTPALTAQPADWTLFLTITGGGLQNSSPGSVGPSGIGVDSTGSVWVAAYFNDASKFTTLGAPVFPAGVVNSGLNNSYGLAMDPKNNVWIPNEQPNNGNTTGSVSEFNPAGISLAGTVGFTAGGMDYPISTAVDPNGTVWVVDYGNSHLTLLNSAGVPLSGTDGYSSSLFAFPVAVVVDANHFGWVANQSSTMVTKVAPDGSSFVNYDCCNASSGLAIDQGNNVWVANYFGASVSLISNTGAIVSKGTYTGNNGIDHPQGIAVDGAGNIWISNFRQPYLSELSGVSSGSPGTSLTPSTGYGADSGLLEAYAVAVDASGNLWVSNFGSSTITKFIGLATPVKTPLSGIPQLP